mgnify:CR=1 FL=1
MITPSFHFMSAVHVIFKCLISLLLFFNQAWEKGEGWKCNLAQNCHKSNLVVKPEKGKAILWYNHFLDEKSGVYLLVRRGYFSPIHMVRNPALGKLRMRKLNTNRAVPLDVVPERRTKRCSPRFRPGGRFCVLRFRYLSLPTGREGEISRPLDHM